MPIDYNKYPKDWLKTIRPRIMKRANNCCEFCGLKHGQTVYSIKLRLQDDDGRYKERTLWMTNKMDALRARDGFTQEIRYDPTFEVRVVLTIAHLDHDEENHEVPDERLKALCQMCHLRYDSKEKYRRIQEKYRIKSQQMKIRFEEQIKERTKN